MGCGFQIVAIFLANKRPVKRWVTVLHSINQLFFALIYLVPFINITPPQKAVLFVAFLLLGHILNNIVNSPKINWYMSLVDDNKRGRFTANKEIVSLITGMVFSFVIGSVMDYYDSIGNSDGAFIVCGLGVFGLTLLHTFTLIYSQEKPVETQEKTSTKKMLGELIKDKDLFKVILVSVLWNVAHYTATPFYGTYQIKELGFSMTLVSLLSALYAVCRSLFSKPMGKFADKYSFKNMLNICFMIALVSFAINAFTTPGNGKVLFTVHYMLYAVSMAGINSATINLIYDYVDKEKRTSALALSQTFSGLAGFFTTLIIIPLVSYIQNNGNVFFGIDIFAQQVCCIITAIIMVVLLVYLNTVMENLKKKNG